MVMYSCAPQFEFKTDLKNVNYPFNITLEHKLKYCTLPAGTAQPSKYWSWGVPFLDGCCRGRKYFIHLPTGQICWLDEQ